MRYFKYQPPGYCNSCTGTIEDVVEFLREADPNEVITITVVEMTEEEYAALPEFIGF